MGYFRLNAVKRKNTMKWCPTITDETLSISGDWIYAQRTIVITVIR